MASEAGAAPGARPRIALVGAGRMGSVHLRALQAAGNLELTGVVEPFAPRAEQLKREGLTVYETPDQLVNSDRPDGVLVAAPSDQHRSLVTEFAAAGVSVMCEKPLGVRRDDAAGAAQAAEAAGTVLQVGYWRRFVPELRRLRERVAAGELGQVNQLACMQWDEEPPNPQFRAASGGIAIDMGVHEFDQTRWLLGQEFETLSAVQSGPDESGDATPGDPDAATVLAQLSGGAAAIVSLGRRFPHADSCWLELWATRGYERVPFMWDAAVWEGGGEDVFLAAMIAQAEAFARAVNGEPQTGAGGEDAIAALAVAERVTAALSGSMVKN
jgi:myo-inositol 2-dehydrogenase/D-chiro-inositol 1-dehydrogenase